MTALLPACMMPAGGSNPCAAYTILQQSLETRTQLATAREAQLAKVAAENAQLHGALREMCDMVAPTIKSESRLSQGLSGALIRARLLLKVE